MSETPLAPTEGFKELHAEIVERSTEEVKPPKKKVGRPSNAEIAARGGKPGKPVVAPVEILPPETVAEIIALPFELYAKRKGAHWELQPEEKKKIGELTAKVLNKHAPEWLAKWGDELGLCTVVGMALISRMLIDANERAKGIPLSIPSEADLADDDSAT
jgi:hypothetical protein